MFHLKRNVFHGLKAIDNMGIDLRAYGRDVEAKNVNLPECLSDIHDGVMDACRQLAEAGEGEDLNDVLNYYIDRVTAM